MGEEIVCGYKLVRELGTRQLRSFAAIDPKPRRAADVLCVVERLARGGGVSAESAAEFLRDGKRLTQLRHPNLVPVRDVVLATATMLLVTDWVDGEVLSDVQRLAAEQGVPIPLGGSLRVVVDLLEGLSALHEVRDAKREPLNIVHTEVAPRNIVVGIDGRSVLVHPLRPRTAATGPNLNHPADVVGYLAPEVLLGDQTADQRADVYGAGVLLWEALAGERMHAEEENSGEIVMRLLGGKVEAPSAPASAPWAAPLAEVAKKAVSPDPSVRYANATAMLADVRRVVGARLAPKLTVAALVEALAGERIRARVAALGVTRRARLPSESSWTTEPLAATPRAAAATPDELTPLVAMPAQTKARLDPEAAKLPPPSAAPPPPSPRQRAAPSWGKVKTPSSRPSIPQAAAARVSEPPALADVVEVVEDVEIEVPPDHPARPRPPVPPRREKPPGAPEAGAPSPLRLETPMRQSRTEDVAALVSSPAPSGGGKTRWVLACACACAVGAAAVLWFVLSAANEPRTDSNDSPAPSVPATAAEPPRPAPPGSAAATASPHAGSDPSAVDPPADDRRARGGALPISPPIPTVSAPVPPAAPPAPAAAPAQAPGAPPAASSTHPKKRVYDPMGI